MEFFEFARHINVVNGDDGRECATGCAIGKKTERATLYSTYSLTTAEPLDAEYELAWIPNDGRSADLGCPNFPNQRRHSTISLRPWRAKGRPLGPGHI